ncbi:D-2-hydroxyacid dehydrogenase [Flavobacteriaceae bacterium]|nr:D-2-hydroxyacid dehydrogenase [Flavobacteriaceae bacterium]MDB4602146.1 D-2-hydroxyacid dehydrogenase [Flavobacteriaceae bacterium]MDC0554080.1 D-2-hydroxyacid dehydrogenase [Flavobacteriaceae bacterium]MDC0631367.1 D-2-hydroxyacid dehydrogenase [Flavobacteriaceae bacterium]
MNVLANDGISNSGVEELKKSGFNIITTNVAQEQLENYINKEDISVILVRSATTVRKELIDKCPGLKIIGRGGVGMDNIDVEYARSKNISVINTPAASSSSVAELVFAHLYSGVRFLHESNRSMPLDGDSNFKKLKKAYAKGVELRGKTLGIIGFGRIGRETAKIAIGVGMNVLAYDKFFSDTTLELEFMGGKSINIDIKISKFDDLLKKSDFISLHVPAQKNYVIDKNQFKLMKDGVGLINAARGGVVNEVELVNALDSGKVSFAGLDTFENEPKPEIKLLMHPRISLTPHIGAATNEAQDRIGIELAQQIAEILK